jgi:uncharacterized glyoxalase superfamily protein PhnB
MKLSYVILYVESISNSISFYEKAFDLEPRFIHESGDYAELETGDTVLGFCSFELADSIIKQKYIKAKKGDTLLGSQITLEPESVAKAYQLAIDNGAISISEPELKPWGFEVAIVADNQGHIVEFAKKV